MSTTTKTETLGFQTEVKQLLHLMIHSLYSNKEIFLRELISNASDAADKMRFAAVSDGSLYGDDSELAIHIKFDKEANTLSISDNGIGMNRADVIDHLGTIAKSGTSEFLQNLTGDQQKDSQLIGQFGVGFYSSFIVADEVEVITRKAGSKTSEGVHWRSKGEGEFDVSKVKKTGRGTEIILHLKADEKEFAEGFRLRSLVRKYSDHISIPVIMMKEHYGEDADKQEPEEETVNSATALWTKSRSEVKDEEYHEFYKHVSHDFQEPLSWAHNKVEGKLEYTSLLYIPSKAPMDMWQREATRGLKLYVQRVFIMDEAEQFLPMYLRFIKGVVDSNDLSLNPEMSRRARAIELWAALKYLGKSGVDELVFGLHQRAVQFADELKQANFTVHNDVVFNQVIVSPSDNDGTTMAVLEQIQSSGECWVGSSVWQGSKVIRISVCSWMTSPEDISRSVRAFIHARELICGK